MPFSIVLPKIIPVFFFSEVGLNNRAKRLLYVDKMQYTETENMHRISGVTAYTPQTLCTRNSGWSVLMLFIAEHTHTTIRTINIIVPGCIGSYISSENISIALAKENQTHIIYIETSKLKRCYCSDKNYSLTNPVLYVHLTIFIPTNFKQSGACRILSCGLTNMSIGQEVLITTSSARRSANCPASKVYTTITIQYTASQSMNECVEKNSRRCLTRACDRRAIRLAYGPSTGTVDLGFFKDDFGPSASRCAGSRSS